MTANAIDRPAVRQFNPIYGFYGRGVTPRPVKGPFCMALRPEHTKGAFSFCGQQKPAPDRRNFRTGAGILLKPFLAVDL